MLQVNEVKYLVGSSMISLGTPRFYVSLRMTHFVALY
jgi:hypothetical protein